MTIPTDSLALQRLALDVKAMLAKPEFQWAFTDARDAIVAELERPSIEGTDQERQDLCAELRALRRVLKRFDLVVLRHQQQEQQ